MSAGEKAARLRSYATQLTRERLLNSRWIWGETDLPPITTSFYFGEDGLIQVYAHWNERSWILENGVLKIFNAAGLQMWSFEEIRYENDTFTLLGRPQLDPDWNVTFSLSEYKAAPKIAIDCADFVPDGADGDGAGEGVRLVIWDLDDTFWHGTLSEGGITLIPGRIELVRALNARGIVNSICSKNDHAEAEQKLRELGCWDAFVFPEISWSPKGAMVKSIIRNSQLRPVSVMFIDDNTTNLNEAKFYVPGLQIAEPSFIESLLSDPRFAGKPDPQLSRLARYKVLEAKLAERYSFRGDNQDFLRESRIKVSFHTDVEAQFGRVHDLVNRTNQLNFTKNRWPEDIAEARERFHNEMNAEFYSYCGYVKVSDRYGQYGICGFYLVSKDTCVHMLFSCRSMNMGVEQFVWRKLGRPYVPIRGSVISDIDMPVDWIDVVEDADYEPDSAVDDKVKKLTVCIRGACDMTMMSNFLKTSVNTIEELDYDYQGWQIATQPRIAALHDVVKLPENQAILAKLPGQPPGRFKTDLAEGRANVYVMSFSQESFQGLYRSKSTDLIIPMGNFGLGGYRMQEIDYTKLSYQEIIDAGVKSVSAEQWDFFTSEFEFMGGFNEAIFVPDVRQILGNLRTKGKRTIIVGLNSHVGRDTAILSFFARINAIVEPLAAEFGCDYVDINPLFHDENDLAKDGLFGGPHFARHVYVKISEEVLARIRSWGQGSGQEVVRSGGCHQ
jgi:FkbH-like protein